MYRVLEESGDPPKVDFKIGVAVFIKFVRETLNLSPKDYSDLYLEAMVKPFA